MRAKAETSVGLGGDLGGGESGKWKPPTSAPTKPKLWGKPPMGTRVTFRLCK